VRLQRATREWRARWRAAPTSTSFPRQIWASALGLRIRVRRFDSSRGHRASSCGIHGRWTCDAGAWGSAEGPFVRSRPAGARLSRDAHWRAPGAQERRRNDCEARSRAPLLDRDAPWHADLVTACLTTDPEKDRCKDGAQNRVSSYTREVCSTEVRARTRGDASASRAQIRRPCAGVAAPTCSVAASTNVRNAHARTSARISPALVFTRRLCG
jgi:hypothetical protein